MDSLKLNFQEGDLPSLHPHALMIYLRGISIAKTLYEGLTRIDAAGKAQLAGAHSVQISADRKLYTFKLKDNRWSDGTLVTAFQYEAAWKESLSPTSNSSRADLLYMLKNAELAKKGEMPLDAVGVKAHDAKTLVVELAYPSPYFLELAAQPICAPLLDSKLKEPSAFNGPFMVQTWNRGDSLSLVKNPHFWNSKQVVLDQITIYMVQDTMTAYSLYEKKEIDWIGVPFVPLSNEILTSMQQRHELNSHPVDRVFWMFLNTEHPALTSSSIRQALSLAIDRHAITKHIFIGSTPLEKPLPAKLLPGQPNNLLTENLVLAKQKFEAGLKESGLSLENFPPLTITYSQQANRKQLAEFLQQIWTKAFGVTVHVVAQEWNVLRSNLEKGLFDISGSYEAAFYNDPLEILSKMLTLNANNFTRWVNPLFQAKVLQAKAEERSETRNSLLAEAEQIILDHMPFIPISSDVFKFSHVKGLTGFVFDSVGACDFSYANYNPKS